MNTHTDSHTYGHKRTKHPCVHADPGLLVEQGGFWQNVDFVTGVFHINEEEHGNGSEAKNNEPDHSENVCQDYQLDKRNSYSDHCNTTSMDTLQNIKESK